MVKYFKIKFEQKRRVFTTLFFSMILIFYPLSYILYSIKGSYLLLPNYMEQKIDYAPIMEEKLRSADDDELENVYLDIEELHDEAILGHEQYGVLMALYAELTGDHSIISKYER